MTFLKKLLKTNRTFALILLVPAFFLTACSKEEKPAGVAAKVGTEKLTEAELQDALKKDSSLFRQEYIRNWIETRVFYAEAKEEKLTDFEEYKRIVAEDKARIAGALLIMKYLRENAPEVSEDEEREYFEKHKDEFASTEESFVLNKAVFESKLAAGNFRYVALEKDWKSAVNFSQKSKGLVKAEENLFLNGDDFMPGKIRQLLAGMEPGEVSIVFPTERKHFAVVQLIKKFAKGETPDFEFLRKEIEERILVIKRKKLIKKYKQDLYSKFNVEIY